MLHPHARFSRELDHERILHQDSLAVLGTHAAIPPKKSRPQRGSSSSWAPDAAGVTHSRGVRLRTYNGWRGCPPAVHPSTARDVPRARLAHHNVAATCHLAIAALVSASIPSSRAASSVLRL